MHKKKSALFTHAAAVKKNDKVTVIFGKSGSGKSTLLWSLLMKHGYNYLSNDQVLLHMTSNDIVAHTWPLAIRLGRGLVHSEYFGCNMPALGREENIVMAKYISNNKEIWGERIKYELSPKEFIELTGRPYVCKGVVSNIIFADLSLSATSSNNYIPNQDKVHDILTAEITEPSNSDYLDGWLLGKEISTDNFEKNKHSMMRGLSCINRRTIHAHPDDILQGSDILENER